MRAVFLLVTLVLAAAVGGMAAKPAFNVEGNHVVKRRDIDEYPLQQKLGKMCENVVNKCVPQIPLEFLELNADRKIKFVYMGNMTLGRLYNMWTGNLNFFGCAGNLLFVEKSEGPIPEFGGAAGVALKEVIKEFEALGSRAKFGDFKGIARGITLELIIKVYSVLGKLSNTALLVHIPFALLDAKFGRGEFDLR